MGAGASPTSCSEPDMAPRRNKAHPSGRVKAAGGQRPRDEQRRQCVAQEAARLMVEDGILDFALAKRKAAARLGVADHRDLPSNQEIEQSVIAHQRLFHADSQPRCLRRLREAALQAMGLLKAFEPRLVGPVLSGTAGIHSPVNLHLFADTPEELGFFLAGRHIPYELDERSLRMEANGWKHFPLYRFIAGETAMELTVFPAGGPRAAPLSPVDGRPMRRASIDVVRALLEEEDGPPGP